MTFLLCIVVIQLALMICQLRWILGEQYSISTNMRMLKTSFDSVGHDIRDLNRTIKQVQPT